MTENNTANLSNDPKLRDFSAEDREFLARFFEAHPKVGEKFVEYLVITPAARVEKAQRDLKQMRRSGWVDWHVRNPETVYEHTRSLMAYVKETGQLALSPSQRERLIDMAEVHDLPEAIASDFTPYCGVDPKDKDRIELLAARVIFESPRYGHKLGLFREFIAEKTYDARLLNDLDKLHSVIKAEMYEQMYQEQFGGKLREEFRTTSGSDQQIKTDAGKLARDAFYNDTAPAIAIINACEQAEARCR